MRSQGAHPMDLTGQVAVVTGAGSGIGTEIAVALASAGARVVVAGRRRQPLETVAGRICSESGEAAVVTADVTRKHQVDRLITAAHQRWGPVDVLVNNAGTLGEPGRWWEMPAADWWPVMEVNLKGAMHCCQAVLPGMLSRGQGRIINLASNAGVAPIPALGPYAVSKAALLRLTDSLALDLAGTGVTVFAISPGLVNTDLTRRLPAREQIPEELWLTPERAAQLCLAIAGGRLDRLSGRYLHAEDDVDRLLAQADAIVEKDLHTLRLRKGPTP